MEAIKNKTFSIIIVTYNSHNLIIDCINSIYDNIDIPEEQVEIIIVDNSNVENNKILIDVVNDSGYKILTYHNIKNGGYGQGNNIGIKLTNSKLICVVNPDVLFLKPFIKKTLNLFQKNKKLAMIGGKQYGGLNISFWIRPEYDLFFVTAPLSFLLNKLNVYSQRFFYLSGALLVIDKDKFQEIGMFDEEMFLYCEEADVTKRFLKFNYQTKFVKDIEYKHLIDDRVDITESSFNSLIKSTKYYLLKHNYSFQNFLKRKIISYRFSQFLYEIVGKKQKTKKAKLFLNTYKKLKENV